MVPKSTLALAVAWFLMVILVASTVSASGCAVEREGSVLVPFGPLPPPALQVPGLHGVVMYVLANPESGPFRLGALGDNEPEFCLGSSTCLYNPDFNIAFYDTNGIVDSQVGPVYDDWGPVEGSVPETADYAMVWMTSGVDAEFVFEQRCQ